MGVKWMLNDELSVRYMVNDKLGVKWMHDHWSVWTGAGWVGLHARESEGVNSFKSANIGALHF